MKSKFLQRPSADWGWESDWDWKDYDEEGSGSSPASSSAKGSSGKAEGGLSELLKKGKMAKSVYTKLDKLLASGTSSAAALEAASAFGGSAGYTSPVLAAFEAEAAGAGSGALVGAGEAAATETTAAGAGAGSYAWVMAIPDIVAGLTGHQGPIGGLVERIFSGGRDETPGNLDFWNQASPELKEAWLAEAQGILDKDPSYNDIGQYSGQELSKVTGVNNPAFALNLVYQPEKMARTALSNQLYSGTARTFGEDGVPEPWSGDTADEWMSYVETYFSSPTEKNRFGGYTVPDAPAFSQFLKDSGSDLDTAMKYASAQDWAEIGIAP